MVGKIWEMMIEMSIFYFLFKSRSLAYSYCPNYLIVTTACHPSKNPIIHPLGLVFMINRTRYDQCSLITYLPIGTPLLDTAEVNVSQIL